ncbi:DUF4345 domain-containing protein [Streptomyces aureoversilis]|uniref:DUF4345 domain-containing protein n=1 Tax=Streptomyces aureoversilis TaxID=67277 RepID=A0ABV9ZTE9_9ACTN
MIEKLTVHCEAAVPRAFADSVEELADSRLPAPGGEGGVELANVVQGRGLPDAGAPHLTPRGAGRRGPHRAAGGTGAGGARGRVPHPGHLRPHRPCSRLPRLPQRPLAPPRTRGPLRGRRRRRRPPPRHERRLRSVGTEQVEYQVRLNPLQNAAVLRDRHLRFLHRRWLAGVFLLGGVGRLLSLAVHGWPQWFQIVLAVIELGLPPVFFWLADAEERALRGDVEAMPVGR